VQHTAPAIFPVFSLGNEHAFCYNSEAKDPMSPFAAIPHQDAYFERVWETVRQIPPGRVATYGQIAVDYKIQVSQEVRVWVGGNGLAADLSSNWQNGIKPANGENVLIQGSNDCDWNLMGLQLGLLTLATDYSGTMRIVGNPDPNNYNSITVSSHLYVKGGTLDLGYNSELNVQGKLFISSGTLDMGQGQNRLRLSRDGAIVFSSGIFRSEGWDWVVIEKAGNVRYPFVVADGTVSLHNPGWTQFDETTGIILSTNAVVSSFDYVFFYNFGYNPAPSIVLKRDGVSELAFNDLSFNMDVSTNIKVVDVPAGSSITVYNGGGDKMGSPNEWDPNGVLRWSPDGGGDADISGSIAYAGSAGPAPLYVVVSTEPFLDTDFEYPDCPPGTWFTCKAQVLASTGGPNLDAGYSVPSLPAPNDWYLTSWLDSDSDGIVSSYEPRAGYTMDGFFVSTTAVSLAPSTPASNKDMELVDPGKVQGQATNLSSQVGEIIVELRHMGSTRTAVARYFSPSGFYTLFSRPTDYLVLAYVDVNNNRRHDDWEASGSSWGVRLTGLAETSGVDFDITGGAAQAGGTATLSTETAHIGFISNASRQAMLKLGFSAGGGAVTLNGLKVDVGGDIPASPYAAALYADENNNGVFDPCENGPCPDSELAMQSIPGGQSSATLNFWQARTIPSGESRTLFLTLNLQGQKVGSIGLSLGASTYFGLSQGSMADQGGMYPVDSGNASVMYEVLAQPPAGDEPQPWGMGGFQVGQQFIGMGQQVTIIATGTWFNNYGEGSGPDGIPGTEYQGTLVPEARRGQLLARTGAYWVPVGTGTTFTSMVNGSLFMAMNDYQNDYWNNSGKMLVDFSVSGTTIGTVVAQIQYDGLVGTNSMYIQILDLECYSPGMPCISTIRSTNSLPMSGAGIYYSTFTQLPIGEYGLYAYVGDSPEQSGGTGEFDHIHLAAGATEYVSFPLKLGAGTITGTLTYDGVMDFGPYRVFATTSTDFEKGVKFEVIHTTDEAGGYTMSDIPAPATYYILATRDGNYDNNVEGPEPLGVYRGGVNTPIAWSLAGAAAVPVFVDVSSTVHNIDMALNDMGAVNGMLVFEQGYTEGSGNIIVGAGQGQYGSSSWQLDSRTFFRDTPDIGANGSLSYFLGLVRPNVAVTVFAFVDTNGNEQLDSGEPFTTSELANGVPPGGGAPLDLSIGAPAAPPAIQGFEVISPSTGDVVFTWNLTPGATGYQIGYSGDIIASLGAATTRYQVSGLAPNSVALVGAVRATNDVGPGPMTIVNPLIASLPAATGAPSFSGTTASSTTVSWAANSNDPITLYLLQKATAATGPFSLAATTRTATYYDLSLAPQSTYYYRVWAKHRSSTYTIVSPTGSLITPASTDPSITGLLAYAGSQDGNIWVAAFTSSGPFSGLAAAAMLPPSANQPYFLEVPGGGQSYFVRAFVDVTGNNMITPGEDWGAFSGAITVAASPVTGKNFSISVDTTSPKKPTSPTGVASFSNGRGVVKLAWVAPSLNTDGSAITDPAGYRVYRTTNPTQGFTRLSSFTVYGVTGTVSTASFQDDAPVAGLTNIYRIRAVDWGNNESNPSILVSILPKVGGSISGSISTFTASTQGAFKVRLATVPFRNAGYVAEATVSPFTFTGLQDREYFLRGFRDTNSDSIQAAATEPSGTHGGIASPFPIHIIGGNRVTNRIVTICDRTNVSTLGDPFVGVSTNAALGSTDCAAVDRGQGHHTDLWTFRVGGGGQGTIAPGSRISANMWSADFSPWLILLGPNGNIVQENSSEDGAFIDFTVNEPGLYILEPTSFDPFYAGQTGNYDLYFNVIGGQNGAIEGNLTYSGGQTGDIYLQLFNSPDAYAFPFLHIATPAAGGFRIEGLPDGEFYLRSFMDLGGTANGSIDGMENGVKDPGEPVGAYGTSVSSLTPIFVFGGVATVSSADLSLAEPAAGALTGAVTREGTKTGTIVVKVGRLKGHDLEEIAFASMTSAGNYSIDILPPATDYTVLAFVDSNGNNWQDPLEAKGSSSPVTVSKDGVTAVNLLVRDPGFGSSGSSVLKGTVTYAGSSTGTVIVAFGLDEEFNFIPYLLSQTSTGTYQKTGLQGNTSYYIGAFIDVNGDGVPNDFGAGAEPSGMYQVDDEPARIFVPVSSAVFAHVTLEDPPSGVISGTVTYQGTNFGPIVVEASQGQGGGGPGDWGKTRISTSPSVSSYAYAVQGLRSGNFELRAFVDLNNNGWSDFGEPFFMRTNQVPVSSGTGLCSGNSCGVSLFIFDAGAAGTTGEIGRIEGSVDYFGSQPGPIIVQAFTRSDYTGVPVRHSNIGSGTGNLTFSLDNLPSGTYYLRAFRDAFNDDYFDPAFEPSANLDGGASIVVSADAPVRSGVYGQLTGVGAAAGAGSDSLSGAIDYRGAISSSATARVMLFRPGPNASIPVFVSTYAFSFGSPVAYSFPNLEFGHYTARAYLDYNANGFLDAGEPLGGDHAGGVLVDGSVSGRDFDLCDRSPLTTAAPGVTNGTLQFSDCRSNNGMDYMMSGARPYQKLYTFSGTRGQMLDITVEAVGFYDSFLNLIGPRGRLLVSVDGGASNNNARLTQFPLPETGVFTLAAMSFAEGVTGGFKVTYQGSAGRPGSIAGTVAYEGTQGGRVFVVAFSTRNFDDPNAFVRGTELSGPGAFSFLDLPAGTSYYLGAFVDGNPNGFPDPGEDTGEYYANAADEAADLASPIFLRSGQDVNGIVVTISSDAQAGGGNTVDVEGSVHYLGQQSGNLSVGFWPTGEFTGHSIAMLTIPASPGITEYPFEIPLPADQSFFARAFIDNAPFNYVPDPREAFGVYSPAGFGAEPIFTPGSGELEGIDFTVRDPQDKFKEFLGSDVQGAAGEGTVVVFSTPASVSSGDLLSGVTIQVLVGAAGIQEGGELVIGVPPRWPFPQTGNPAQPGYIVVTATNPAGEEPATLQTRIPFGAPALSAYIPVGASTPLFSGATVQFVYHNAYIPCGGFGGPAGGFGPGAPAGDSSYFYLGSASNETIPVQPLFSVDPETLEVEVVAGSPRSFYPRFPHLSLQRNTTSEALILDAFDQCGNLTAAAGSSVTLKAQWYDYSTGNSVASSSVSFATSTAGTAYWSSSATAVTYKTGRSSATFYARASGFGELSLEIDPIAEGRESSFMGLSVLNSNPLSSVRVSTTPFGAVSAVSAIITPNGDGFEDSAYISFDINDPFMGWEVLLSSIPFKSGVSPTPIWQFWGQGQPRSGQIAWDGRYSPWLNGGVRVSSGAYYVRVRVGEGIFDDSLRIHVRSSQLAGKVFDAGVTPRLPLSGVEVRIYGNRGSKTRMTDAKGEFSLNGVASDGSGYILEFFKPGYMIGRSSVTIGQSAGGSVALGAPVTLNSNVVVSSTTQSSLSLSVPGISAADGVLKVLVQRAPSILVTPTSPLSAATTRQNNTWGNIQVHNASFTQVYNFPMRILAGTRTIDDGGRWDSSLGREVAKKQFRFDVPPDTYTVRAFLPGFGDSVTQNVYVNAGQKTVCASGCSYAFTPFAARTVVQGWVRVPAAFNSQGMFVSVQARPVGSTDPQEERFSGVFLPAGNSSSVYKMEGLVTGDYEFRANAPFLRPVSTSPVSVSTNVAFSTAPLLQFADPTASFVLVATVAVVGDTSGFPALETGGPSLRVHTQAIARNNPSNGFKSVGIPTSSAGGCLAGLGITGNCSYSSFTITGLEPNLEYQVFAGLDYRGDTDFSFPAPATTTISAVDPKKNPDGSLRFVFYASSGSIEGLILLGDRSDFGQIDMYGKTVKSPRLDRIGETFTEPDATTLPGFRCGGLPSVDASSLAVAGVCPGGISSATFRVEGLTTETYELTFLHKLTGRSRPVTVSVVDGLTTRTTVQLTPTLAKTYFISGAINNQISTATFNTNLKIFQNSPHIPLRNVRNDVVVVPVDIAGPAAASTATIARVIARRQEFDQFSTAVSTAFNSAKDRIGYLTQAGTFTIRNVPPGVYVVSTEDLRLAANGSLLVPRQRQVVSVSTNVRMSSFTLTDGYSVAGTISLANGITGAATLRLTVLNGRREIVRTTTTALGNTGTNTTANSVAYSLRNLPRGEFYTLMVEDTAAEPSYVGSPLKFPDPNTSPKGLNSDLSSQNMTLYQAAYVVGQLQDAGNNELITRSNVTLLPSNFEIFAVARPWEEGGFVVAKASMSGRPVQYDGTFLIGPLIPNKTYDLRFGQPSWDVAYIRQGSRNYTPVEKSGVVLQSGKKNIGIIALQPGQSIKGKVVDAASTTTALGNIQITAVPSFGDIDVTMNAYTDEAGRFTLWVSTYLSAQYDVTVAPRGGNLTAAGNLYETVLFDNVTVSTQPLKSPSCGTNVICLGELQGETSGYISTADDGALSYPFGDNKGFPAAAVFLQPVGVVPNNPLGDIEIQTESDGWFHLEGIEPGDYVFRAVSLGYSVLRATLTVASNSSCISSTTAGGCNAMPVTLELQTGSQLSGSILLSDGNAPSMDEVGGVAASNSDFTEFVVGTVETDANARTVTGYAISGFKTGVTYDIVILPQEGENVVFPVEGQDISFSSTTNRTLNLTFSRTEPECRADASRRSVGNNQYQIKITCTEPLRNSGDTDNDLAQILSVSCADSNGEDLRTGKDYRTGADYNNSANCTGSLNGGDKVIEANRKVITAIYRSTMTGEAAFSLKLLAYAATLDGSSGQNFQINKVFDFKTGPSASKKKLINNMQGGEIELTTAGDDQNAGRGEKFKLKVPPGSLKGCVTGDSSADNNCKNPATNNEVTSSQQNSQLGASFEIYSSSTSSSALGSSAFPSDMYAAMKTLSAKQGGLRPAGAAEDQQFFLTGDPLSSFYSIFLPLGVRTQLAKAVNISLPYDLSGTSSTIADLNIWSYSNGTVTKETGDRTIDTQNQTITVSVDHFSTFAVFAGSPIFTSAGFTGGDIEAYNFPNPFDCTPKTKTLDNISPFTFTGTAIRYGLPAGQTAEATIRIYTVSGELVREFSQGQLPGGNKYYSPWDCKNQSGRNVASGVYIIQISWGGKNKFIKAALIKGSGL